MEKPLLIVICEDIREDADRLKGLIQDSGIPADVDIFSNSEELLRGFSPGRYDVVFMDIYLNGMLGIESLRAIREKDENIVAAFTTSSPDHTLESYRIGAFKYLEKPVTAAGVRETLEYTLMKRKFRASINLLTGGRHTDIPLDEILYFEQRNHVVLVHTAASGVLQSSQTVRMDGIEARLPSPPFLRCHHSFIVNLRYVNGVGRDFLMKNGDRVYIRKGDVAKMKVAFEDYLYAAARGDI